MDCLEITPEITGEFYSWLLRENPALSEKTMRDYRLYTERLVGVSLCGKESVKDAFEAMGGVKKSSYEAFSRFLTFLEKTKELDALVAKLRKAMPRKPRARADTYVPDDETILAVRERIRGVGPPYTLFYNVLVSSGCRGTEARYLILNAGELRAVRLEGYVRIHIDLQRGSKNEFVIYVPEEVYEQLERWERGLPSQDHIEKVFREKGLAVKYFRKWWRQTAKKIGIDSEDIEAFQGRVTSIGGRHYTDWIPLLDADYAKLLPTITKFIIRDGV